MNIFPHVLAGAAVGSLLPNVPLAIGGGIVSHVVVDLIPHWDPEPFSSLTRRKKLLYAGLLAIDLTASIVALSVLFPFQQAFWGGLVAALTDLDNFLELGLFESIGIKIHLPGNQKSWQPQVSVIPGIITQILVIGLSMMILGWKITGG